MWLDHAFHVVFGIKDRLDTTNAERLRHPEFRPRALTYRLAKTAYKL